MKQNVLKVSVLQNDVTVSRSKVRYMISESNKQIVQKHDEITHIFCIKFDSRKDSQTLTETNAFKCEKHFSIIKEQGGNFGSFYPH